MITTRPSTKLEYVSTAREDQSTLAKNEYDPPPVGKLARAKADEILARHALNSMATCLYLLREASVNLGNIGDARNAYKGAMWYTYAWSYDPPSFWSPAAAAHYRVQMDLDSWDHGQARAFADFLNDFNAARKDACRVQSQ